MAKKHILTAVILVALAVWKTEISSAQDEVSEPDPDVCDVNVRDYYNDWKLDVKATRKGVCPKGQEPKCVPCEKHTYDNRRGFQQICIHCPNGTGTIREGVSLKSGCIRFCREGKFVNATTEQCDPCPQGTYMPISCIRTECRQCPEFMTTDGPGAKSIEECGVFCPAGQQGNAETGECEPCPEGTYKEEDGVSMCKQCTATGSKTTLVDGATNRTRDCIRICGPGKEYIAETDTCQGCLKGYFKAEASSREKCKPCGFNQNTEARGSDHCIAECGPGWEDDSAGGCSKCWFGQYKATSGNIKCDVCPTLVSDPTIPKMTTFRGATSKADCVKLDTCVADSLQHVRNYYDMVSAMDTSNSTDIASFMKNMCYEELSVVINQIVAAYRNCADFRNFITLDDIEIGGRVYSGEDQKALFVEAADYNGGHYCHYLTCMKPHLSELRKCKMIMEDDTENPRNFCSPEWRAGAKCTMLNVKNCPPLRFHPAVVTDMNLGELNGAAIYEAQNIESVCELTLII